MPLKRVKKSEFVMQEILSEKSLKQTERKYRQMENRLCPITDSEIMTSTKSRILLRKTLN